MPRFVSLALGYVFAWMLVCPACTAGSAVRNMALLDGGPSPEGGVEAQGPNPEDEDAPEVSEDGGEQSKPTKADSSAPTSPPPTVGTPTLSPPAIGPTGTVTLQVTATHPSGVRGLTGVVETESGAVVAPLTRLNAAGTFQATFSWDTLNEAEPIQFTGVQSTRVLVAVFDHPEGGSAKSRATLKLQCSPNSQGGATTGACSGTCVNVEWSNDHCGQCGNACLAGWRCVEAQCICDTGRTACPDGCWDLNRDKNNCGQCGRRIEDGYCLGGTHQCDYPYQTACGGRCVQLDWDENNCGQCGNACGQSEVCVRGRCASCTAPETGQLAPAQTCNDVCGAGRCANAWGAGGYRCDWARMDVDSVDAPVTIRCDQRAPGSSTALNVLLCKCN